MRLVTFKALRYVSVPCMMTCGTVQLRMPGDKGLDLSVKFLMAYIATLRQSLTGRYFQRGMTFRMTTAAVYQFLTMWMFMTPFTFRQYILIYRLAFPVNVKLPMTPAALHTSMRGPCPPQQTRYNGMTLHALLSGHVASTSRENSPGTPEDICLKPVRNACR